MKKIKVSLALFLMGTLVLSGCTSSSGEKSVTEMKDGKQSIVTTLLPREYEAIEVQVNVPVVWEIEVSQEDLNGCNNEIIIPEYGVSKKLQEGSNIIEFIPNETGTFPYSCWMGMIRSEIKVVK